MSLIDSISLILYLQGHHLEQSVPSCTSLQKIQRHKGAALARSVSPGCLILAPGTGPVPSTVSTLLPWQKETPVTMIRGLDPVELACSATVGGVKVRLFEIRYKPSV